jgi:lipid-A-disaccharide synthase
VSPQVWAWRRGRLRDIRRYVERMLVLFPFEPSFYAAAGIDVRFVGHPLVDHLQPCLDRASARAALGLDPVRALIAVLPGSRRQELRFNLPPLAGAVRLLAAQRGDLQFALPAAPGVDIPWLLSQVRNLPITVLPGRSAAVLGAADLGLVASGTATVEAALVGTPMVVVYRVAPLSYALGKSLVHVPHYAMVNLIAGRRLVPEIIQKDFTPERVAAEALRLMAPEERSRVEAGLLEVRRALGEPGASRRAAVEVADALRRSSRKKHLMSFRAERLGG